METSPNREKFVGTADEVTIKFKDGTIIPPPLKARDLRGSRLRCLKLTSMPRDQVAEILTGLVSPTAVVAESDSWMPQGFSRPAEARLDESAICPFVPEHLRDQLKKWWLKRVEGANTPNWDLVSTCRIQDAPGLLLIEAKAHYGELKDEGKPRGNTENDEQIRQAIRGANLGLNEITQKEWGLSAESEYQLSNRFAWAWKVASLGIPTILVYLGFLRADEMTKPFESVVDRRDAVKENAHKLVPDTAWGERPLQTKGAKLWALIRSLDLKWIPGA